MFSDHPILGINLCLILIWIIPSTIGIVKDIECTRDNTKLDVLYKRELEALKICGVERFTRYSNCTSRGGTLLDPVPVLSEPDLARNITECNEKCTSSRNPLDNCKDCHLFAWGYCFSVGFLVLFIITSLCLVKHIS